MNNFFYLLFVFLLFLVSIIYFKIARAYKIVDLPNHRTMHKGATIRGGGIVVWIGMIIFSLLFYNPGFYFLIGLFLIGLTGFLDDIIDLSSRIRFPIQAISIVLIIYQLDLIDNQMIWLFITVIVATGVLNAFNFMDGINGMTAGYSLVFVVTLIFFNYQYQEFISVIFLYGYLLALIIFSFFNFRNKAICFAGDVGSLSIAFINVFLLIKLIIATQNVIFIFFFTVYGIDTIFTIIQRMIRKENIFEAHRLHLFQEAVSHFKISHLQMTSIYMFIQILINLLIIYIFALPDLNQWLIIFTMLLVLSIVYIWLKTNISKEANHV